MVYRFSAPKNACRVASRAVAVSSTVTRGAALGDEGWDHFAASEQRLHGVGVAVGASLAQAGGECGAFALEGGDVLTLLDQVAGRGGRGLRPRGTPSYRTNKAPRSGGGRMRGARGIRGRERCSVAPLAAYAVSGRRSRCVVSSFVAAWGSAVVPAIVLVLPGTPRQPETERRHGQARATHHEQDDGVIHALRRRVARRLVRPQEALDRRDLHRPRPPQLLQQRAQGRLGHPERRRSSPRVANDTRRRWRSIRVLLGHVFAPFVSLTVTRSVDAASAAAITQLVRHSAGTPVTVGVR